MGVLQTELETELSHSKLVLQGVKYLQLLMIAALSTAEGQARRAGC